MSEFWAGIAGVAVGAVVTTVGHLVVHQWTTSDARKRDEKRKAMLTDMLNNPGPTGWREMETMAGVIGASREETARLLVELDARASETGKDVWAFVKDKPLPDPRTTKTKQPKKSRVARRAERARGSGLRRAGGQAPRIPPTSSET